MDDIDAQIQELTDTSPAVIQQEALNTKVPDGATTHQYGIGLNKIDSPVLQEPASTQDNGITMSRNGDPLVAGTALPNNEYDTSYVKEDEGSPLYFKTGVYDSMPWPELEVAEQEALNKQRAIYMAMGANSRPDMYIGYTPLPEEASLSWWSHAVGSVENAIVDLVPVTIPKAGVGFMNATSKMATSFVSYPLKLAYTAQPDTVIGRWAKGVDSRFSDINERLNSLADWLDDALSPIEKATAARYQADLTDTSMKADLGRAVGPATVMIGLNVAAHVPSLAAAGIFSFSQANEIRKQALDAGVSPAWADVYSSVVPFASTALDNIQILSTIGVLSLTYKASKDTLKNLTASGLTRFGKTLGREALEVGAEGAIEITQNAMEEWYNPEFQKDPLYSSAIAGITAMGLRAVGIPASVRHARLEQQQELARKAGVLGLYNQLRTDAVNLVNEWADKGIIDPSKKNEVMEYLISRAPDELIENLRLGIKGDMQLIPEKDRAQMLPLLKAIESTYGPEAFSPRMFQIIDKTVDTNISDIRGGLTDAEVTMIKGLVRGGYVVATIAHRGDQNYKGFQVPKFVVTDNAQGSSWYSPSTNTIGIHSSRSDVENNNYSPSYADMIRKGFIRSSNASDKIDSIIHEMGHWLDAQVGSKGFGDFFKYYYGSISEVFGKEKAKAVKEASGGGKSVRARMPSVGIMDYTSEKNATEYAAQALGRLGKRAAEYFGLGRSQSNKFLSYANIMMNQLANIEGAKGDAITQNIADFQTAMQVATRQNMTHLADLIDEYGSDEIKQALQDFTSYNGEIQDFAEYLASKNMLRELYKVMDGFADAAGLQKINDLFDNDTQMDNFVTAGDYMFKSGFDTAVEEVRQRRLEAKAKDKGKTPKDAIVDPKVINTPDGSVVVDALKPTDDTKPTWFDNEKETEEGVTQYEEQDWAKNAKAAQDSVKASAESGAEEPKPTFANTSVDGRDLKTDVAMSMGGAVTRAQTPMNPVVKWFASSRWGWGLDRILTTILGRDVAEQFDVAGRYTAKKHIRSQYWEEFMGRLGDLFGDAQTNKTAFMFKYKTMTTDLGMVRMKNVMINNPVAPMLSKPKDITGWEAMYVYLMKRQGKGDRIQLSTQTNIDDIISVLSPDEIAFADAMSDQLTDMFKRSFGKVPVVNYFPIQDATHDYFNEVSINSLIARQDTNDAIAITDAGRVFSQYLSRWASHESGYFQTIKRLRDVFGYRGAGEDERGVRFAYNEEEDKALQVASAQLAHIVRDEIGEGGYNNLMAILENQLTDGQEQMFDATRNSSLNQIGNNIVRSLLSFKPISFVKNTTNLFMMWGGAKDQSLYWNSFAEGIGDMKRTWDYMVKNSPEIKQRWGGSGINEYLDQSTLGGTTAPTMKALSRAIKGMDWNSDVTNNMAKFSAAMDMMGDAGLKVFMQFGDMVANVYGGYGLIKDYMAQGMTEKEAFKKLDRYIIERQSSSNLTMKPLVQLEANKSILGQVFAFISEGVAKVGSILGTFDEVKMGSATKSEAIANAVSIAVSMALFTMIGAGAWDLLSDDEDKQKEAEKALADGIVDQVFSGFVAGNAFLAPMFSQLVGDTRISGMQVPIYNYITDEIVAIKKAEYDRLVAKALSAMGVFVGADNVWNSMLGASLIKDPNPAVREAGALMLSGYSPQRAKKRTKVDVRKETVEKNEEE